MNSTFDPGKDAANQEKHGFSLLDAASLEWDSAVVWPDQRREYDEPRMVALGYIGLRTMTVVFVDRSPSSRLSAASSVGEKPTAER